MNGIGQIEEREAYERSFVLRLQTQRREHYGYVDKRANEAGENRLQLSDKK